MTATATATARQRTLRRSPTLAHQFVRRYNATNRNDYEAQNAAADWAEKHGDCEEGEHGGCVTIFRDGSVSFHDPRAQRAEVLS